MHMGDLSTCRTVTHAMLPAASHQAPALQRSGHCAVRLGGLGSPVRGVICWGAVTMRSNMGRVPPILPCPALCLNGLVRSKLGGAVSTAATAAGRVDVQLWCDSYCVSTCVAAQQYCCPPGEHNAFACPAVSRNIPQSHHQVRLAIGTSGAPAHSHIWHALGQQGKKLQLVIMRLLALDQVLQYQM